MTEEQLERKKQKQKEKRRRQREKKQEKAGASETQEVAPPPPVKEVNDKFASPGHKLSMVEQARPMLSLHCR